MRMNFHYEERLDILAWNLKQKEFAKYDLKDIELGLERAKLYAGSGRMKRDRNWKMFILKHQYRITLEAISSWHGVTKERVRQLVKKEERILRNSIISSQRERETASQPMPL
jgi:hypothetical protein